jgi:hypothetical protein
MSKKLPFSQKKQQFENDGVHLTKASGKDFINAILYYSKEYFKANFIDLEVEEEGNEKGTGTRTKPIENDRDKTSKDSLSTKLKC